MNLLSRLGWSNSPVCRAALRWLALPSALRVLGISRGQVEKTADTIVHHALRRAPSAYRHPVNTVLTWLAALVMLLTTTLAQAVPGWGSAASLTTGRYTHTATLLPSGKVLVAGGYNFGYVASAELYDPATNTWSVAGSLATARDYHTATLLPNGRVLVAGGYGASGYLDSAELYDPATDTWSTTGSLGTARRFHTATLLPSGKVLVTGGYGAIGILASAEVYDPVTNAWAAAVSLATGRYQDTATLLPNGKVLISGGEGVSGILASAELYDPATDTWSATGSLGTARRFNTATLLPSGKVLVSGGQGVSGTLASAELYDPVSNTWSAAGSLATARFYQAAALLPSGKVLVSGGSDVPGSYLASAELYDPVSNTWSAAGSVATARYLHTATLLPSGKVLVAGGDNGSVLHSAELYDPASERWEGAGSLATARVSHTATLLPNGKVLFAGGANSSVLASAELYDRATNSWSAAGSLTTARVSHTATLLPNGSVLVMGGTALGVYLASAELYDPPSNTWVPAASAIAAGRVSHTATLMPDGKVLIAGGRDSSGFVASAELYNPASNVWSTAGSIATVRWHHTATLLPSGKVLVTGGYGAIGILGGAELYDPATNSWSAAGSLGTARSEHTATLLPSGKVLVSGGYNNLGFNSASAELYDPTSNSWSLAGSLIAARVGHTATLLPSGRVLVAGGHGSGVYLVSAELYDPAINSWTAGASLAKERGLHTATLLPNGEVLVAVGSDGVNNIASAERFAPGLVADPSRQPTLASVNAVVLPGTPLLASGSGFWPNIEASGGGTNNSATNLALFQVMRVDSGQTAWLAFDPTLPLSNTAFTSSAAALSGFPFGHVSVRAFVNGIPSEAKMTVVGPGGISVVTPATLSFAMQRVGTSSGAKSLTMSNTGNAVLNITSIVVNGDYAKSTTCGSTLAVGANCVINVTFTPTVIGTASGGIVITSDSLTSPNTVPLSGTGIGQKAYADNGDGTVTDPTTGLTWMRCSMGQIWDGTTCTGTAGAYTWDQAVALTGTVTFAGQSDWRLPNIRELQSIVERAAYDPAVDAGVFPNSATPYVWSSSTNAFTSSSAWLVFFHFGSSYSYSKSNAYQVRLVRAGQPLGLLDTARPAADYTDQGNGTVTHIPTGLTWQRCAIGQIWTGTTCSGTANTFTWDAAKLLTSGFAGQSDWRLPTEEEMLSLPDYTLHSPAINVALFPSTAGSFWSASALIGNSSWAWNVNSVNGGADYNFKFVTSQARLVRAGRSFGPLALAVSKTGTGEVASSVMPGIECGSLCSGGYYPGDVVTLNATPAANLIAWGGDCASAGAAPTCVVTMDAAKTVTASFLDTPLISGLPAALTFPLQNIGSTSAAQTVTMTNTGTAALNITSITASSDFAVNHNCGSGLGVGGFCTLNISFAPTAIGVRTGSVTVASDAPGSPQTITLTGTGQGSTSVASPSAWNFGTQGVGTTSTAKTITLSNTGGAVLNIASIVASGDFARTTSCGATLAQGSNCSINVTFSPASVGALTGSLVITSDALSSPSTVSLSGTGVAVALVSLNPTALSFANQNVGSTSAAQAVRLTNTGGAALSLGSIVPSGDFSQANNCGGGLGAGGFCDLSVTFTPTLAGARTGAITIISNAVGSPHSVSVTGTGVPGAPPVCTLIANPAIVLPGQSSTLTASCSPAATSFSWSGGTCAGVTTSSCTDSPTVATSYSVTGTNSFGSNTANR